MPSGPDGLGPRSLGANVRVRKCGEDRRRTRYAKPDPHGQRQAGRRWAIEYAAVLAVRVNVAARVFCAKAAIVAIAIGLVLAGVAG